MDDLELLRGGLSKIETHWEKGMLHNKITGCYCAIGAMGVTELDPGDEENPNEPYRTAVRLLAPAIPEQFMKDMGVQADYIVRNEMYDYGYVVWEYNDDEKTTHDDVIAMFKRAIEIKEKELEGA